MSQPITPVSPKPIIQVCTTPADMISVISSEAEEPEKINKATIAEYINKNVTILEAHSYLLIPLS